MPSKKKKFNSRFPPARIKKIMQTDEDVGKVAAAVPVIISRALELFIESLILKSNETTQSRHAKTLSTAHIKQTIQSEKKFDFLSDLVANIPDHQPEEEESSNPAEIRKPKISRPRKPRTESAGPSHRAERKTSSDSSHLEVDEEDEDEETESDDEDHGRLQEGNHPLPARDSCTQGVEARNDRDRCTQRAEAQDRPPVAQTDNSPQMPSRVQDEDGSTEDNCPSKRGDRSMKLHEDGYRYPIKCEDRSPNPPGDGYPINMVKNEDRSPRPPGDNYARNRESMSPESLGDDGCPVDMVKRENRSQKAPEDCHPVDLVKRENRCPKSPGDGYPIRQSQTPAAEGYPAVQHDESPVRAGNSYLLNNEKLSAPHRDGYPIYGDQIPVAHQGGYPILPHRYPVAHRDGHPPVPYSNMATLPHPHTIHPPTHSDIRGPYPSPYFNSMPRPVPVGYPAPPMFSNLSMYKPQTCEDDDYDA